MTPHQVPALLSPPSSASSPLWCWVAWCSVAEHQAFPSEPQADTRARRVLLLSGRQVNVVAGEGFDVVVEPDVEPNAKHRGILAALRSRHAEAGATGGEGHAGIAARAHQPPLPGHTGM